MTLDDITKAAQERLDALDAEAKPHEDALATINAERARLRLIVAADAGVPPLPVYPNLRPLLPPDPFPTYPDGPQWVPSISPRTTTDWPWGTTACGTFETRPMDEVLANQLRAGAVLRLIRTMTCRAAVSATACSPPRREWAPSRPIEGPTGCFRGCTRVL